MNSTLASKTRVTLADIRLNQAKAFKSGIHNTIYWVQAKQRNDELTSARLQWKVSTKYRGDWNENKKNGFGVLVYKNKDTYEGNFVDNKREGEGTFWKYREKTLTRSFTGFWRDDKREGKGTAFYESGDRYDGFWNGDLRHGFGRMTYANGDYYLGMWWKDQRCGYGMFTKANGDNFEGVWLDDKREGFGSYFFANSGNLMIGEWVDDTPSSVVFSQIGEEQEGKLLFPPLQLDSPIEVVEQMLLLIRKNRKIPRILGMPIELAFDPDELGQLKTIFSLELAGKSLEAFEEFFSGLGVSLQKLSLEETIKDFGWKVEDLKEEEFLRLVFFAVYDESLI